MRLEIRSASLFLSDLLRLGHSLTDQQLQMFRATLEDLLRLHYNHHWFPERPAKGSGYRCIRINHKMDPMIAKAAQSCGLNDSSLLRNVFPNELTLWIDPREVSYRIGENGSICVLYDAQEAILLSSSSSPPQQQQQHHQSPNRSHLNHHQQHHLVVHRQNNNNNNSASSTPPSNILDRYSTCKESVRGMDNFIMDRRNLNLDQFAPYVSS